VDAWLIPGAPRDTHPTLEDVFFFFLLEKVSKEAAFTNVRYLPNTLGNFFSPSRKEN
jgi:hypothetical protein